MYSDNGDKITTIEGNTSNGSSSSAVAFKTRYASSSSVMGYGRPNWDNVTSPTINPPSVSSLRASKVFTEHAIVEVDVTGEEITSIMYNLNTGEFGSVDIDTGLVSFKVPNLVPNTTYTITVTAENSGGSDSATTSFKTLQDYPSPIQGISLKSTVSTNNEADLFSATISPPERWGYWKDKAGHDYGYRLFLVSNCKLLAYKDVAAENVHKFIPASSFDAAAKHEDNLQAGIITWVIDNTNSKIFDTKDAGNLYPVCSNSICLKELSEMSDILYFSDSGAQRRTQPYMDGQPVNIFKILLLN